MHRSTISAIACLACVACLAAPAGAFAASTLAASAVTARPSASGAARASLKAPSPSPAPLAGAASAPSVTVQVARIERVATIAYAEYLHELRAARHGAYADERAFAEQVNQTCRGALYPVAKLSSTPPGWSTTLTQLGAEIGADASIVSDQSASSPFAKLTLTLSTLHWPTTAAQNTVSRFLQAGATLLALTPSNLCADAFEVLSESSSQTASAPPPTEQLLGAYDSASQSFRTRLTAFLKQLGGRQLAGDRRLAARVNALARRINVQSARTVSFGITALEYALGISPPPVRAHRHARATLGKQAGTRASAAHPPAVTLRPAAR